MSNDAFYFFPSQTQDLLIKFNCQKFNQKKKFTETQWQYSSSSSWETTFGSGNGGLSSRGQSNARL